MFGNEDEYKIPLANTMRVGIINFNIQNLEVAIKIQEKIIIANKKRFQVNQVESIKDLFKYKEKYKEEPYKGLINQKWINNINNFVPSVVILYYFIKSGANKEIEEKNIFLIIEEIRNYSKSCNIFIIIIYKDAQDNQNKLYFNFDDKQKPYYLKNYLTKDCFYILPDEEIWKLNEFGEICNKILYYSRQFYKYHKKTYQEKRSQSKSREEKVENDIKLGVISVIKSQKQNVLESKYLEEAYEILCDKKFDLSTYKYGIQPNNIKNNFYEVRAAADWLFFKFNYNFEKSQRVSSKSLSKKLGKDNYTSVRSMSTFRVNINDQIKKCERHINCFSNNKYYDNGPKDYFHFVEYYWLLQRYINLTNLIEENIAKTKVEIKTCFKLGKMYLKEVYNSIRLIKFYNKYFKDNNFNLLSIIINDKKIDIKDIKEEENIYFGKPPSYYITNKENSEQKEIIGYNDEIYIKKFILDNKINYEDMLDKFKSKYWHHLSSFFNKLRDKLSTNSKKDCMKGIIMYIYLLKIKGLINNVEKDNIFDINDINDFYPKNIYNYERIKKFPKVYMDLIKQYTNLIRYKMQKEEDNIQKDKYKTELFINLSLLGNIRKLDSDEEKLFYELLNDTQFIPRKKDKDDKIIINLNYYDKNNTGIINCNNLAINFDYSIKNIDKYQERKLLDLIEYVIKFNSSLSNEKIKFNSLKLFFEYSYEIKNKDKKKGVNKISEMITKEFNKEELDKYQLGLNSNINIFHKLLIKYKKGKILLTKIIFTLCKKEDIFYSINLPNELNKTIFIIDKETNILNIKYPKNMLTAGLNQLFKFEYIINKEQLNNIKITDYKHAFQAEKMNKNNLISQIGDKYNNSNKGNKYNNLNKEDKYNNLNKIKNISQKNVLKNKIEDKSDHNQDSLINFIFDDPSEKHISFESPQTNLIPPTFYYYDETKQCIDESKNVFEYIYNNFESRLTEGKNKYDILIKFANYGLYTIKLNIKYFIEHEEVDAKLEFNHEEIFYFKVVDPLPLSHKINSNNYLLYNNIGSNAKKSKEYLTDTNINMNLIFNNLLDEDILIKDIILKLNQNKDIEINSTVKEIIDSKDIEDEIKEQILCILKSSSYTIPYDIKFLSSFSGSLGKIKIVWTTKSLNDFEKSKNIKNNNFIFKNENEYELPIIDINRIKINIDYEYKIQNDNEIIINAKISNNSLYNKKLTIKIVTNDENAYIISGLTKFFINLKNGEKKRIYAKLIVLQKGELKLPDIVIKERDYNGHKISCNYYCPEKIILH